jgi:DegV family protein with EDD domain
MRSLFEASTLSHNYGIITALQSKEDKHQMRDYIIATDNAADLPDEYIQEKAITILFMDYSVGDVLYTQENQLSVRDFYDKMRQGAMPTTMAANPEASRVQFAKEVEKGRDVLMISFSSGMSSTFANYRLAAQMVMDEYAGSKVCVVDSLASCGGQALQVMKAVQMKEHGVSIDDNAKWLQDHALNFSHFFTVSNLFHLYRGGRLSRGAAIVGTLASVKPLLYINDDGKLVAYGRTHGRKKSIEALADAWDTYASKQYAAQNDTIYICHGDCEEDAQELAELMKKKAPDKKIMIHALSPVVGSHGAPGILTLHFMCDRRF